MEILNEIIKQQQQIQKSLEKLNKNISENNNKAPIINVDSQVIVNQIKNTIPKTSDFDVVINKITEISGKIPAKVEVDITDEVWGFASLKTMLLHYGITFFLIITSLFIYKYWKEEEIEKYKRHLTDYRDTRTWLQEKYPKVYEKWEKDFFQ